MNDVISIYGFADPFSSMSHFSGAIVFAGLSIPLLARAKGQTAGWVSLAIFCAGAVLLLSISGVYHLLDHTSAARSVMQRLDHAAIFVLIAASFTPAHVILFRGWRRWGILALVWTIAVAGILQKTLFFEQVSPKLGIAFYLGMGWIGLYTTTALWRRRGFEFISPMFWGGIAYSIGAILEGLHWPVLIPGVVQWHEIFHLAVLVGLGFHWAFNYHLASCLRDCAVTTHAPDVAA